MKSSIRVEGLRKSFRDGDRVIQVLDHLSLDVGPGEFVALLGRSGSGKSTLLNCIAGLERPEEGRVFIEDVDTSSLDENRLTTLRRDRIGIIFQFFNLIPVLTVEENVLLPSELKGAPREPARRRARDLLHDLELDHRRAAYPQQLSGGEQQRVATARALINEPAVLLADEPTGNLDRATASRTLELLQDVNTRYGVSILMATHSAEAADAANLQVKLTQGRVERP